MKFEEFIKFYDRVGNVVLLEGKRNVAEEDKLKLIQLGSLLTQRTKKIIFRSGNADGSDFLFSSGVSEIDRNRLQIIIPYKSHRTKFKHTSNAISLEDIDLVNEYKIIKESKANIKMSKLIDEFISGNVNKYSIKAAYIIRDTVKAIGTSSITPTSFGIFYDDLVSPKTGGTGHTMLVCESNNIPIIDQRTWFKWLD